METSLRYSGESKSIRLHAKEKLPLSPNSYLKVQAELDTRAGVPSYICGMIKNYDRRYPVCVGVGMQYDKYDKLGYTARSKISYPVALDGLINFNIRLRADADEHVKKIKYKVAAEFTASILEFQEDQDLRLKFGFNAVEKVPYMQIKENNWILNADLKGRWSIRYDL